DLGAGPLAEQHAVADLDVESDAIAVVVASAIADGDDLALARLLLGAVGDDDAAGRLFLGLDAADQNAVVQRTECHVYDLFHVLAISLALSCRECQRRAYGSPEPGRQPSLRKKIVRAVRRDRHQPEPFPAYPTLEHQQRDDHQPDGE